MLAPVGPQKSGRLATARDCALQAAGTGSGLHIEAVDGGREAGHMDVPVIVTPMGASVCPEGQNIGLKTVMKYAA